MRQYPRTTQEQESVYWSPLARCQAAYIGSSNLRRGELQPTFTLPVQCIQWKAELGDAARFYAIHYFKASYSFIDRSPAAITR
jgi:hypothetical protein